MNDLTERQFQSQILERLENRQLIDRFEDALFAGAGPIIEASIPEDLSGREIVLEELIHAEIEWRGKRREPVALSDYLIRFPQIADNAEAVAKLRETIRRFVGSSATDLMNPGVEAAPVATIRQINQNDNGSTNNFQFPKSIGRYSVEKVLGHGGFGTVYLAYDDQLRRHVAIKVPHAKLVARIKDAEAYLMEARMVANLDHSNIVPVLDVGSTEHFPCYVVCKYIDGTDLAARLKHSGLNLHETVELVATVAEALHYAHKQGLVHRDVKPGNILLDRTGKPFVSDFGLALREQDAGTGPRYIGTPAYMSPEQARGEGHRVDGRSDIFSLCVVFYELLTGRRPFKSDTPQELVEQITSVETRPPRQVNDAIPKELERICLKSLSKLPAERYTTAKDLAEDLRHFLADSTAVEKNGSSRHQPFPRNGDTAVFTPTTHCASGSQPIKIVPKGLRSFDARDADFFLELLPGPRDRDGLPDIIRSWKSRIEEADSDNTFSVGLIYGPSGCGKSSLIKAGLLPRVSIDVIAVYVEATAEETEARLLNGLRKRFTTLPADVGLTETLAALRRNSRISGGMKVLLVLDQFEQWLHAKKDEENTELVQALRQCDGGRIQCIVMVRDEFWLAVSRFLRELEVRLQDGHNVSLVDLFDPDHAKKVLAAFGRAFGKLPDNVSDTTKVQQDFLKQSVAGLTEDGRVICVRLALFAEIVKGKMWTSVTLKEIGGAKGVGATFLEETFSSPAASPEHRYHQKATRAVLKDLLPGSGTEIKGTMRSYSELLKASGYVSRPEDFDDLVRILDSEIRLITPTDPEGKDRWDDSTVYTGTKYYQLTHDYLVPSLRDWLTRKQKESRRGRTELRLEERTSLWSEKRENRQLPSVWEYLTVLALVPSTNRTDLQEKMLAKARRVHATRWGTAFALVVVIGFAIAHVFSTQQQKELRGQTVTAVNAVQNSRGPVVAYAIRDLRKLPREMVANELKSRFVVAEAHRKLGLAYALADYADVDYKFLCSQIRSSAPDEVDNLVAAFGHSQEESLKEIRAAAAQSESDRNWRLKARLAIVALHLGDEAIAIDICGIDDRPDPVQRTIFIDEFAIWHGDICKLGPMYATTTSAALRSAFCMAIGSADRLAESERAEWKPIISNWYQAAPDNVTHSASDWALRQWKVDLSALATSSIPDESGNRFVNSLGMTMLKIRPGQFMRRESNVKDAQDQSVKLTRTYYLCDREVTFGQFRQFIAEAQYPDEEKSAAWDDQESTNKVHPIHMVRWYDAIRFCNWLSHKEGLSRCYERTGKKEKIFNHENDEWQLAANGTGYRLPTEAEWEYACRAGTTTDFSSGNDEDQLRRYAVYQKFPSQGTARCGSKLPNGWGLFDMQGNIQEWCYDWYAPYGTGAVTDPIGPSEPPEIDSSSRVTRGGCSALDESTFRASFRYRTWPASSNQSQGFRIACNCVD